MCLQVTSAAEVQDIKRARTLMKSMVTSNPSNARGWIAYARLEEVTGNLKTARTLIGQVPKTPLYSMFKPVPFCSPSSWSKWPCNSTFQANMSRPVLHYELNIQLQHWVG